MQIRYNALYQNLLQDLSEAITGVDFYVDVDDWPDISLKQKRGLHLKSSFFKKLEDVAGEEADRVALEKFLQSNIQCRDWSLKVESSPDELLVGQFKHELYNFFTHRGHSILSSFAQIVDKGDVGPGASVMARGGDFYTKLFDSPLTATSKALARVYANYVDKVPYWRGAEMARHEQYGDPHIVSGSRLSFVPKNEHTSRTICTEPTLNMFYQLGIGNILTARLRQVFGIDLSIQQDINRDLARIGSLDNRFATVDLSSASDTIGLRMLQEMMPSAALLWLTLSRSPTTSVPGMGELPLYMISSMGNGFTFPLETCIFACAVSAVYKVAGIPLYKPRTQYMRDSHGKVSSAYQLLEHGNFGVFGDDIIVTKERGAVNKLYRLLHLLGFQVNADKSFVEGPFRESCGSDFFNGQYIRGVYIKSLRTQASRYVAINRLNQWSAYSGIPLTRTVSWLQKKVRFLPVPLHENDDAGIKIPFSSLTFNVNGISHDQNGSVVYRRWAAKPVELKVLEDSISRKQGAKGRLFNPDGLVAAFLRGNVRDNTISIRHGSPRYCTKVGVTPHWDHFEATGGKTPIDHRRLINAICTNLKLV